MTGSKLNRRHVLTAAAGLSAAAAAGAAHAQTPAPPAPIDHVTLSTRDIFVTAHAIRAETGLGFYDGGFNANGTAAKIFPLGAGQYLMVEGVVDPLAIEDPTNAAARAMHASVANGDVFRGFYLRAWTLADLQAVTARNQWAAPVVNPNTGRIRNDGSRLIAGGAPPADKTRPGMPSWNYFPEPETHPSGTPVITAAGLVRPEGIAWLEVGGAKADMDRWIGGDSAALRLRFNGKAPGVHALAVKAGGREIVIRRPPAAV